MEQTTQQKVRYSVLKTQKQFLKLIAANVINRFGDSIDAIAYSWMMYEITGSASLMALILGLNYLPTILLQPIAGVLADRMKKKRIMVLTDVGRGLVVIACVALYALGALTPVLLAVMTMLNSVLESLRMPAGIAVTPYILEKDLYTVGEAANATASRVSEIVGLAAAGAVVALIGVSGALLIDAVTFFLSALLIGWMRFSEQASREKIDFSGIRRDFSEGFSYLRRERLLKALLLIGMLINFCMIPLNSFGTPYVVDVLHRGAEMLSAMQLTLVVGMGLGSFVMPKLHRLKNRFLLIGSGILTGISVGGLWAVPAMGNGAVQTAALLLLLFLLGFACGIINVIFGAAFIRFVPQEMLGRMGGITNAVLCASMPVGAFLFSGIAALLSVPQVMLLAGILTIVLYCILIGIKELKQL